MAQPFRTSRLVEFHDTDMAGIMHFASFFVYMESAEHELLRSLGFSVHAIVGADEPHAAAGETISFPRVSATCEYASPARCEEVLDVEVSVARIGQKSITYEFRFTRGGEPIALGRMTSVCCRMVPGEKPLSRPIPQDIVAKLRTYAA